MATKSSLRAEMRRRRRERDSRPLPGVCADLPHRPTPARDSAEAEGIARNLAALASSMGGVTLPALFVPTPLEPDLSLALGRFPRALLPILVDEAGAALGQPRWGLWEAGGALVTPGRLPAQPDAEALPVGAIGQADLIVVPALAASPDGARLGQGGGWYDRALPHRSPSAPVVAVVFDEEVLPPGSIPLEAHDVLVDAIVTPARVIRVARP